MDPIVVTGATGAMGSEAVRALARTGRPVVMACRNEGKAEELRRQILARVPRARLEVRTLDLSSMASVRAFAAELGPEPVSALLNKKLIEENGRLEAPGRPILYRTTPDFLRTFGLESLEDLPEMEKVQFSTAVEDGGEGTGNREQGSGEDTAVGAAIGRPPEEDAP